MLIIDVHGKWTAGSAGSLASGARFSSRHCKGAPATQQFRHAPFPPLQMASVIISPINCFAPVECRILAKKAKHSIARCRLQFGGAEKRPSAITQQNSSTFFSAAVRAIQQLCFVVEGGYIQLCFGLRRCAILI
jgi:hypothetical protein